MTAHVGIGRAFGTSFLNITYVHVTVGSLVINYAYPYLSRLN